MIGFDASVGRWDHAENTVETGVMHSHLSEIEAGKRNASVDLIGAIPSGLGVPIGILFEGNMRPGEGLEIRDEECPSLAAACIEGVRSTCLARFD